jgi:hypothetical protein
VKAPIHFLDASYNEDLISQVNALLLTVLMTANTLEFSPVNSWSRPKIPRINALEGESTKSGIDTPWHKTTRQVKPIDGVPTGMDFINFENWHDANITVHCGYMHFDCEMRSRLNFPNTTTDQMNYPSA